jgi:hypothetical protein
MALVLVGYRVTVEFTDTQGDVTTRTYDTTAVDFDEATTAATAILAAAAAVTASVISGYSVGERYAEDALSYPAGANNVNTMIVSAKIVGMPYKSGTITIPSPLNTIFVATSGPNNKIGNTQATPLSTYLDLFASAGPAFVSDGEKWIRTTAIGRRGKSKGKAA